MRRFTIPILALLVLALAASAQPDKPAPPKSGPFPALPESDAWSKLPPPPKPALPEWACVMAGPLPKTTAKMLELDYLHRANNPLGPRLAATLRGVVAGRLKSKYGEEVALADLRRTGLTDAEIDERLRKPSDAERIAIGFAVKLTDDGSRITDKEFAELLKHFSPPEVTAIVHTVAYANFYNRIILALGVKGESPLAEPIALKFDIDSAKVKTPDRPPWDDLKEVKADGLAVRVEWGKDGFDELNAAVEKQKERKLRMPLPDIAKVEGLTQRERDSANKILWNTVSMGYQQEMTRAWFAPLYAFYEEAKVDRLFTNSVFWVVTRTNDCFY